MRLFWLDRVEDVSGVSGTGRIAQGVQFDDGSCAMRWISKFRSTAVYASVSELEAIHLHGGKTKLVWGDVASEPLVEIPKPHLSLGAEGPDAELIAMSNNIGPVKPGARSAYDAVRKIVAPPGWKATACFFVSGEVSLTVTGPEVFLYTGHYRRVSDEGIETRPVKHFRRSSAKFRISAEGVFPVKEGLDLDLESMVIVDDEKTTPCITTFSTF